MNNEINLEAVNQSVKQYAEKVFACETLDQVTIEQAYLDGMEYALNMVIANTKALAAMQVMQKK